MADIKTYATPSMLYRYRPLTDDSLDRELEAIREGFVYCPCFDQMNDPMEGLHRESSLFAKASDVEEKRALVQKAKNGYGIASFSEVHDHEPMWAHYADQFRGICISYSFNALLKGLPATHEFVRMSYSEEPPVLLKGNKTAPQLAKLALSMKTIRWGSEREWRLIRPKPGAAHYDGERCVRRVYVGARMDPDTLRRVRQEMGALRVPVFQMRVDEYAMGFEELVRILAKPTKLVIRKTPTSSVPAKQPPVRKLARPPRT